ncbi:MAG: class I SAM-dependent methyltransferase [Candidatus Poribacteria bacterium]
MPSNDSDARAWQSPELAAAFLEGIRGAIPLAAEQIDVMLRVIAARDADVRGCLDLGCGDGVLGAAVLDRYPSAHGVFVDFSQPMLDAAANRLADDADRADLIHLDYGSTNWVTKLGSQGPFDVVVSGFSIHHQTDGRKRELYGEILDILAPGGVFLNVEHVASASPWVTRIFDELFIDALYGRHVSGGGEKSRSDLAHEYYYRPEKAANILAPVDEQCRWLREIGYEDVDCYLRILELAVFGGRKL